MIRNLKALGLVLAAVLAMSAVVAASASAQSKVTSDGPVTLKGSETGTLFQNAFTNGLGQVTCDGSTYTGHTVNWTPHTILSSGATEVTITPHYVSCRAHLPLLGTRHATVTMNGCDYRFHGGAFVSANTYSIQSDVVCEGSNQIEVHVFNSATTSTICTIKVGAQTNRTGAHLRNTESVPADVDLEGTITNVHETHEGSLCGTGTDAEAELHVDVTVKGHNAEGAETGVSIS